MGTGTTDICRTSSGGGALSNCSSSLRYKTNVQPFSVGLSLIQRLRPVTYNWKSNNEADLGLIAEEVNEVEPLLAVYRDSGEIEGVKYKQVAVVLVNAVKEQQTQIVEQKNTIDRQQNEINELRLIVCELKPLAKMCTRK